MMATMMILTTVVKAVGMDLLITFCINRPFTLSLFGSSAKMKDGIPIHTKAIRLNWIGINGYGIWANTKIMAKILA